jgi:hypothetical protein
MTRVPFLKIFMQPPKLTTLISLTTFAAFMGLACGQGAVPTESVTPGQENLTIDVYSAAYRGKQMSEEDRMNFSLWLEQLHQGKGTDTDHLHPRVFHKTFPVRGTLDIDEVTNPGVGQDAIRIKGNAHTAWIPGGSELVNVDFSELGHRVAFQPGGEEADRQPVKTALDIENGQWRVLRLPPILAPSEQGSTLETVVVLHLERPKLPEEPPVKSYEVK